jgi:hypothetical protein
MIDRFAGSIWDLLGPRDQFTWGKGGGDIDPGFGNPYGVRGSDIDPGFGIPGDFNGRDIDPGFSPQGGGFMDPNMHRYPDTIDEIPRRWNPATRRMERQDRDIVLY